MFDDSQETRKGKDQHAWGCIPPPKPHNESEKSRKRKRSRVPDNDLIEHQHNGRVVCTWVPTNKLPVDILAELEDDIVSARQMLLLSDPVFSIFYQFSNFFYSFVKTRGSGLSHTIIYDRVLSK